MLLAKTRRGDIPGARSPKMRDAPVRNLFYERILASCVQIEGAGWSIIWKLISESRFRMQDTRPLADMDLDPVQGAELTWLVDLEARWENSLHDSRRTRGTQAATRDLHELQKAYEAFRSRLQAYNRRYASAHVTELLLNTPARLGKWCRAMRNLYLRVRDDPKCHCPTSLMEKAYRWADQLAARLCIDPFSRQPAPADIEATVQQLNALSEWCDGRARPAAAKTASAHGGEE
jgi:hypothetical protein